MRVMEQFHHGDSCLCLASSCCEDSADGGIEFMSTLLSGHVQVDF